MPNQNGTTKLVPTFKVFINGSELPPQAQADIIEVSVHEDVSVPSMFVLRLKNWDMFQLIVTWVDDALFDVGNEVEVQMGYVGNVETLLIGEITGLEPEFQAGAPPTVTVRGYDRRHRLMRGRKTRSFTGVKDSDIASQIANERGLTPDTIDTAVTLDYVLQHNQTDMEFLQDRAARIGYEVVVEDKTLLFRPRQTTDSEALTLARDSELLEFYPRLTTLNQVGQMAVRGWNIKDKEAIVGRAGTGDAITAMGGGTSGPAAVNETFGQSSAVSVDRPIFTQAEADQIAVGRLNEMALAYVSGEGTSIGRTSLRAGVMMHMEGLGERFSGRYYIVATVHSYTPNAGYRTVFTARRNAT
jgi:phage protein D